jgi:hypothetical protein
VAALADGLPREAGFPVARPHLVRGRETVNSDHARAALGQLVEDGAAHGAKTDHDEICLRDHGTAVPRLICGHMTELTKKYKFGKIFARSEAKFMI